jgi:hypothetical protein
MAGNYILTILNYLLTLIKFGQAIALNTTTPLSLSRWAPLDKNPGEEIENYTDRSR